MKTIIRKSRALVVLALCAVMLLAGSVPAFASDSTGLSDDVKTAIVEYSGSLIEELFTADDETLEYDRTQGDFAQVAVDAVLDNRDTLGEFKEVGDTKISTADDQIVASTEVSFEKMDATVEIYLDQGDSLTPVNFVVNPDYSLGTKLKQAGVNMLIGLVLVFLVLIFLAFIIYLFRYIGGGKKKEKTEEKPEPAAQPAAAPLQTAAENASAAVSGDEEIAAVIAAAIAAAEAEQPSEGGYFVRSIHKNNSGRKWKRA